MSHLRRFSDEIETILALPGSPRLVAVDGPGGSGKSTFAARLARHAGAPLVHTDDFASWDEPIDWWPRLLTQVIEPLVNGHPARYQRYDWADRQLAEWRTVEPCPIVVIEGVTAGRAEWSRHLARTIWIECGRGTRLRRGLERDGDDQADQWGSWMAAEDDHYAQDPVRSRASLIVDGEPNLPHDPEAEFVVLLSR
jgi:uridine kinase